jgi:hypothetical protein
VSQWEIDLMNSSGLKAMGDPEDDEDEEEQKKKSEEDEDEEDDDGEDEEETWQVRARRKAEDGRGDD